ncbi:MAG: alpha/beta hydrolase [Candidatus Dormibacteria bacterium]
MKDRGLGRLPEEMAKPYWLGDGERGVLLLHGFAGTPPEMRNLAEWLAARGFVAYAPLLAGHGTTPEEMAFTGKGDWIRSADQALDELLGRCRWVGVAGQSMGGTLALHLAATRPEVRAVVSQAGMLWLRDRRLHLLPALHRLVPWDVPSGAVDLYYPDAVRDLHSYGRRPTKAILELVRLGRLVRRELTAIVQPLLVLHGGRDGVVEPANADEILARASSSIRALQRFERSGHGMSVDVDKEEVAAAAGRWLEKFVGPG